MQGFPLGFHISNFTQPPFFLRQNLNVGLQSLFAKFTMFKQFLTYRAKNGANQKLMNFPLDITSEAQKENMR